MWLAGSEKEGRGHKGGKSDQVRVESSVLLPPACRGESCSRPSPPSSPCRNDVCRAGLVTTACKVWLTATYGGKSDTQRCFNAPLGVPALARLKRRAHWVTFDSPTHYCRLDPLPPLLFNMFFPSLPRIALVLAASTAYAQCTESTSHNWDDASVSAPKDVVVNGCE